MSARQARSFASFPRRRLAALPLATAAILMMSSCGGPPERTQDPVQASAAAAARLAGDWPSLHGDAGGTHYSPLRQLHVGNVENLTRAWSRALGPRAEEALELQATPLVVAEVMFVAATDHVSALEPETGAERWRYRAWPRLAPHRGLAYWSGDLHHAPRLFFNSSGRLVALNALSGRRIPSFGSRGEVDAGLSREAVPIVFRDLVVVGTGGSTGSVRAYDAITGAERWRLEAASESLQGAALPVDFAAARPGHSMTIDADRAVLYSVWSGSEAASRRAAEGDVPPGHAIDDVIVALDAHSGSLRWYFAPLQLAARDSAGPGAPLVSEASAGGAAVPVLLDFTAAGRRVPAVAVLGAGARLHVLDRRSGELLLTVDEPRGLCRGAGWGGAAFDAMLGYLFFVSSGADAAGNAAAQGGTSPAPRSSCGAYGAELWAMHVGSGDIAWRVPLAPPLESGDGDGTGQWSAGGPMVTGGGLVFVGTTHDGRLHAFDARTGTELWAGALESGARAVPMTYQGRDGKQYVAITAGGAASAEQQATSLAVFALP